MSGMSVSVKVRLQSSLRAVLVVLLVVLTFSVFGFSEPITIIGSITIVVLAMCLIFEWVYADYPTLAKFLAKSLASKFFYQTFEVQPPSKKDWLAMRVCQRVISDKLDELKKDRDALYKKENQQILAELMPKDAVKRIENTRELHNQVEAAKSALDQAEWLAQFFGFSVYSL